MNEDEARNRAIVFLTETSYVEGIWFLEWEQVHPVTGEKLRTDWMATIYKDAPDAPWRITYRFRYHKDNRVWNSGDKKNCYDLTAPTGNDTDRKQAVAAITEVGRRLQRMSGGKLWSKMVRGGFDEFKAAMESVPWGHIKEGQEAADYATRNGRS